MPEILTSTYASNAVNWWGGDIGNDLIGGLQGRKHREPPKGIFDAIQHFQQANQIIDQITPMNANRRIIQVFIADPDINVPLADALLFNGTQKLTDLTDQELFFEVTIADLLAKHNEKRAKWLDKDATKKAGKDVMLEPARIRDLKMTVVNIAAF